MKERPILFSSPMVRALLDGTKTQTRRVMKPQPRRVDGGVPFGDAPAWAHAMPGSAVMRCPYGKRGDRLWVREAYRFLGVHDHVPPREVSSGPVWYEAQDDVPFHPSEFGKLRPSMFMPRWASRITLEVTGVRVERLQDISEADAIAEGVDRFPGLRLDDDAAAFNRIGPFDNDSFPIARYAVLWESINGPKSWDANPWVWAVEFKRITP